MAIKLNEEFIYQILAVVEEIPYGRVATYGQIAIYAGYDGNSRLVGKVLGLSEYYGKFPCHRVVNSQGRCAPHWLEQKNLLVNEGVILKSNGCVDLKQYQWVIK